MTRLGLKKQQLRTGTVSWRASSEMERGKVMRDLHET